jgi:uncharacterized protein (DUF427 family)
MPNNPAPGYAKKPDHSVVESPFAGRVSVTLGGEVIADSQKALAVVESGYGVAYYVPVADVRLDASAPTDHSTYCPFKGQASYLSFTAGDQSSENAAWFYEAPYDEALALHGHVSFYAKRVDSISVE